MIASTLSAFSLQRQRSIPRRILCRSYRQVTLKQSFQSTFFPSSLSWNEQVQPQPQPQQRCQTSLLASSTFFKNSSKCYSVYKCASFSTASTSTTSTSTTAACVQRMCDEWNQQAHALIEDVFKIEKANEQRAVVTQEEQEQERQQVLKVLQSAYSLLNEFMILLEEEKREADHHKYNKHQRNAPLSSDLDIHDFQYPSVNPSSTSYLDANLALEVLHFIVQHEALTMSFLFDATNNNGEVYKNHHDQNFLNPLLQLWRLQLPDFRQQQHTTSTYTHGYERQSFMDHDHNSISTFSKHISPKEIMRRLDEYRTSELASTLVMPDIHSYNILIAAAGKVGNMTMAYQIYEWLWTESKTQHDVLLQPDQVTIRTLFQAILLKNQLLQQQREHNASTITRHEAVLECEGLMEDYCSRIEAQSLTATSSGGVSSKDSKHFAQLYQSLLHIWALTDPLQAKTYILEMAEEYLLHHDDHSKTDSNQVDSQIRPAPTVMDWNRVISALAIPPKIRENNYKNRKDNDIDANNQDLHPISYPKDAEDVLKAFQAFAFQLVQRKELEIEEHASQSLILANQHTFAKRQEQLLKIPRPDLFSYNAVLEGWARVENREKSYSIYKILQEQNSDDIATKGTAVSSSLSASKMMLDESESDFRLTLPPNTNIQPNIVTYTSMIKALGNDLDQIQAVAEACLKAVQEQSMKKAFSYYDITVNKDEGEDSFNQFSEEEKTVLPHVVLDRGFFHTWLSACEKNIAHSNFKKGNGLQAIATAEDILFNHMPSFGIMPDRRSFRYLRDCFIQQDDLEGATQWLLQHAQDKDRYLGEEVIVDWILELSKKGDIELSSFMDRVTQRPPKTLLQVLIQNGHLSSSVQAIHTLLANLPVDQSLQVLEWLPHKDRRLSYFRIVMQLLSKDGDAERTEELWTIAQEYRQDTAMETEEKNDENLVYLDGQSTESIQETLEGMYRSLVLAWAKKTNPKRCLFWWNIWLEEYGERSVETSFASDRIVQNSVLSCLVLGFQPKQAHAFWENLKSLYTKGFITNPPDVVMLNQVLKAWMLAASGNKARQVLEQVIENEKKMSALKGEASTLSSTPSSDDLLMVVPDAISYNTVVQAYVKERKMKDAVAFIQDHRSAIPGSFPNMATFRSILKGWSLHRQDYELAAQEVDSLLTWMDELYGLGLLSMDPPRHDPDVKRILRGLQIRQEKSKPKINSRGQNRRKKKS